MTLTKLSATASVAIVLWLAAPAHAQDIRRIDDRSLTRERHEAAVHANLEIEGEKVQLIYQRETVPGSPFLRVSSSRAGSSGSTSVTNWTYRYLGYDGTVIRFRLESLDASDVNSVLTYVPKAGGRFVFIPRELQYTRLQFELVPVPERGIVQAALFDNGVAR
jgi:hypothetical protein